METRAKFPLLLRLLEAESPAVRQRIRAELLGLGDELDELLLEIEEELSPLQLYEIHHLTQNRKREFLRRTWLNWLDVPDFYQQLETSLSHLALMLDPEIFYPSISSQLDILAQQFLESGREVSPSQLNHYLFVEDRLRGAEEEFYTPSNSNLAYVLHEGIGLPISLACVMILVGRRLGLEIQGFNMPGHFLARAQEQGQILLFDCFNSGKTYIPNELEAISQHFNLKRMLDFPPGAVEITSRVLANLINAYQRSGDVEKSQSTQQILAELRGRARKGNARAVQSARKPTFIHGQIVRHKRLGFRAVVVASDSNCKLGDAWEQTPSPRPNRNQPWYHLLIDGGEVTTYAAQSQLEFDPSTKTVSHPLLKRYFRDFEAGLYLRNDVPFVWENPQTSSS